MGVQRRCPRQRDDRPERKAIPTTSHSHLRTLALTTAFAAAFAGGHTAAAATDAAFGIGALAAAHGPAAETAGDSGGVAQPKVLVRFRAGADPGERRAVRRSAGTEHESSLPIPGLQLLDPKPGVGTDDAIADLERSADVLYAEPDARRAASAMPNDSLFALEWGMHNSGQEAFGTSGVPDADVDAPEAWDFTTGSDSVAVGVVDTGVETTHPDLAPNVRRNPGESGGGRESNGVDDDANGYVDDVSGWDWVQDDSKPTDAQGHGTHVAGTIGARGNDGHGVAGIAWSSGLVPLRVLGADGLGHVSDAIRAYTYAARSGIRVVNASLGGSTSSQAERDALAAGSNTLFVVAAGNYAADNDAGGAYPCNYDLRNVVCVASSDQFDRLAGNSNYGAATVDLAAPGVNVASTYLGGDWANASGTSMATPHVAGAAALVWSLRPTATVGEVRAALLETVDIKPLLAGKVATNGRLNVYRALTGAPQSAAVPLPPLPPPPPPPAAVPSPPSRNVPTTGPAGTPRAPGARAPSPPHAGTDGIHRVLSYSVRSGRIFRRRGDRSRLLDDDGRRVEVTAGGIRNRFVAEIVAVEKIGPAQRGDLSRLELTTDGGSTSRAATVSVRLYDWSRRQWRPVATRSHAKGDRAVRHSITRTPARYVSATGAVRISLRGTAEQRFRMRTDLVRVSTR